MREKILKKPTAKQLVTKKYEKGDLFSRLLSGYRPPPGANLLFPFRQIQQARAWRGHPTPGLRELSQAMATVREKGMPIEQLEISIMTAEILFRPMKTFEIEVEKILPEFFAWGLGDDRFDRPQPESVLRVHFGQLCRDKQREFGEGWLLAAGKVSLSVGGRPPLIAPKVVGAAVAQRMIQDTNQVTNESLLVAYQTAAVIASVLQCRTVRPEEVRHWRELCNRINVPTEKLGKVSLSRYLGSLRDMVDKIGRLGIPHLAGATPSSWLELSIVSISACLDFAKLIPQIERRSQKIEPVKNDPKNEKQKFRGKLVFCCLCKEEMSSPQDIWDHLKIDHRVDEEEIGVSNKDPMNEIRRISTGEILATLRNVKL